MNDRAGPTADDRASWRSWLGLAVLTLPMLVLATDLTVLFLAMPSISADLQPGPSQTLWILHVYGFLIGGFLITMGRLGDRVGRRRLLLIGAAAFTVLSVVAASSTGPVMLIIVRAALGITGATLMPSAFSLLRTMFRDEGQRRFAIAVMMSAFSAGGAAGPLLGGVLLESFWWGSVFLINVPALLVLLAFGPLLLPEYREPVARRLDAPSVLLSLGAMLAIVYGAQELAAGQAGSGHGTTWLPVGTVAVGSLLAVRFVRRQRRLADPLLDLELFLERRFTASLGVVFLTLVGLAGVFYLFTQHLQWVEGLSPFRAGLWTVPYMVFNVVGAMAAPALVPRFRQITVIAWGLLLVVAGLVLVSVPAVGDDLRTVVSAMALAALGQGAAFALASDLIISNVPEDRAGSAAAMQEVSGELGTAFGLAFGGSVGVVAYRAILADSAPAAVPEASVGTASESLPSALTAVQELPDAVGTQLLEAALDAFGRAFQVTSRVSAAAVVVALVALLAVGRRTANDEPEGSEPRPPTDDSSRPVGDRAGGGA